jgi:phospholipid transport system substrate-binding protein
MLESANSPLRLHPSRGHDHVRKASAIFTPTNHWSFKMIQRFLLMSAFVLFFSIIEDTPKSLAATNDPARFVSELVTRALAPMPNEDTTAARQERFRRLFHLYFDLEACARSALGSYWLKATALQRQEFVELYEDYVVIGYSASLRAIGAEGFQVQASQSDKERVIVTSRVQINGAAPISVDWQLNPTNPGYKVTDLIVNGISMAITQHSDLVSFIQRNNGSVPSLLVALRGKNASNGILR